jgi:hypothetical protein
MPFVEDDQQEIAERMSISKAFRKFDTDASGKLERQEFEKAMVLVGMRLTPNGTRAGELWNEIDTDASGVIDLQEFAALVKGIHAGGPQVQHRQHQLNKQQPKEIAVTNAFNSPATERDICQAAQSRRSGMGFTTQFTCCTCTKL